jgi:hypothetical protein
MCCGAQHAVFLYLEAAFRSLGWHSASMGCSKYAIILI